MKYDNKLKVKVAFLRKDLRYATEAIIDTGSTVTIVPPEIAYWNEHHKSDKIDS